MKITKQDVKDYSRLERMNNNGVSYYSNINSKALSEVLNNSEYRDKDEAFAKIKELIRATKQASHADYFCTWTATKNRILDIQELKNSFFGSLIAPKTPTKWDS